MQYMENSGAPWLVVQLPNFPHKDTQCNLELNDGFDPPPHSSVWELNLFSLPTIENNRRAQRLCESHYISVLALLGRMKLSQPHSLSFIWSSCLMVQHYACYHTSISLRARYEWIRRFTWEMQMSLQGYQRNKSYPSWLCLFSSLCTLLPAPRFSSCVMSVRDCLVGNESCPHAYCHYW